MQSTLTHLSNRFGQSVTLFSVGLGEHTVLGSVRRQTGTTMLVRAIVREVTENMISEPTILLGDVIVMVPKQAALTVVPKAGAVTATIDGVSRVCKFVRGYRLGGTVYGYEMVMRGAA
jgi:hypothetical protein